MPKSDDQDAKQVQVFISEAKLKARVLELADEINTVYAGKEIVAICVLKGSFIFFSDLIRGLNIPLSCEFMGVSSYGNKMVSSGEVKLTLDINEPLENKHVIVVEDIVDSGLTLTYIMNLLKARKPASLKSCSLLFKPEALKIPVDVDFVGFRVGREFVVGYGVDYAGKYRELPFLGILQHEH